MSDRIEIAKLEALAEAAYDRMYDASRPKDAYEEACEYFNDAIELARSVGLEDEAARLSARKAHVTAVYNSQFRWV